MSFIGIYPWTFFPLFVLKNCHIKKSFVKHSRSRSKYQQQRSSGSYRTHEERKSNITEKNSYRATRVALRAGRERRTISPMCFSPKKKLILDVSAGGVFVNENNSILARKFSFSVVGRETRSFGNFPSSVRGSDGGWSFASWTVWCVVIFWMKEEHKAWASRSLSRGGWGWVAWVLRMGGWRTHMALTRACRCISGESPNLWTRTWYSVNSRQNLHREWSEQTKN